GPRGPPGRPRSRSRVRPPSPPPPSRGVSPAVMFGPQSIHVNAGGSMQGSAAGVLAATLAEARDALPDDAQRTRDLIDGLHERLGGTVTDPLADALLAFAGRDAERRILLADVIGLAARRLAPDDEPPAAGAAAAAWRGLVGAVDGLYGSGVAPLGRLPFVGD